jgi:hypothetical protein
MTWGVESGQWKEETNFLKQARIFHFLGAPQIAEFNEWKEEVTKFLVSHYHSGYLWLNYLVAIMGGLIHRIMGIPHGGTLCLKP